MDNLSVWQQFKRLYAFEMANKSDWQALNQSTHNQVSKFVLLILICSATIGFILTGKNFLGFLILVLPSSFVYLFFNDKTVGAMKFISVISCLGISWLRIYLVGWQTILYNQIQTVLVPLPIFIFTGSYKITSVSFLYVLFYNKYNGDYIQREFEIFPEKFHNNLSYLFDNLFLLNLTVWIFLSLLVYQKNLLISQLWTQQKEKEDLLVQVQKKNRELELLHKDKAKLLLGLSHEFRNPINAALGNLELANEKITDPGVCKYLVNCKVSIEMLYHLVSNLLDSTKLEAGILELNPARKNSNAMFQKVWSVVRNLLDKQNLVGEFYIHKKIPRILNIDSHFAIKILLNLVLNAIKYTHEGAVMTVVSWVDGGNITEDILQPTSVFHRRFVSMFTKKKIIADSLMMRFQSSQELAEVNRQSNSRVSNELEIPNEPTTQVSQLLRKNASVFHNSINNIQDFHNTIRHYNKLTNLNETHNPTKGLLQNEGLQTERVSHRKGYLKIEVLDSGCGIDFDALKDSIFKKSSSSSLQTGDRLSLGLGLWLTKSLCECMGGQVKAFSEKDKGSQFVAIIPTEASDIQSEEVISMSTIESKTLTVELNALVVDDDKYNREISSIFLSKAGASVKAEAVNGKEALQIFVSKPPNYFDLVVMDLEMPVMNGKEAIRRIRKQEKKIGASPMKVIIATGNCDLSEYSECMDKNGDIRADLFYRKPLLKKDVEEFVDLLRREKVQKRPICLLVDGDCLTLELLQSYMSKHNTHLLSMDSIEKAESAVKEWRGNVKWVLLNLGRRNELAERFVRNTRELDAEIEIIGLVDSLDTEQRAFCRFLKVEKILRFPLHKEEISEVFGS